MRLDRAGRNPVLVQMALAWLEAEGDSEIIDEVETHQKGVDMVDRYFGSEEVDSKIGIAIDRVYQVLIGEVKWSEASPGDKAIWRGRVRDPEKFDRIWNQAMPDGDADCTCTVTESGLVIPPQCSCDLHGGVCDLHDRPACPVHGAFGKVDEYYTVLYDTVPASSDKKPSWSAMAFGAQEDHGAVGDVTITNQPCNGFIPRGWSFAIDRMFVTIPAIFDPAVYRQIKWVSARLIIGDFGITRDVKLESLLSGVDVETRIREREPYEVRITGRDVVPFEICVHLEGKLRRPII